MSETCADPAARLRACGFAALLVRLRTIRSAKLRLRPRQDSSLRIFRLSSSSVAKDLGEKCLLENDRRGLSQDDTRGMLWEQAPTCGHVWNDAFARSFDGYFTLWKNFELKSRPYCGRPSFIPFSKALRRLRAGGRCRCCRRYGTSYPMCRATC